MFEKVKTFISEVVLGAQEGELAVPEGDRQLDDRVIVLIVILGIFLGIVDGVLAKIISTVIR